jgi:hypothetical protein
MQINKSFDKKSDNQIIVVPKNELINYEPVKISDPNLKTKKVIFKKWYKSYTFVTVLTSFCFIINLLIFLFIIQPLILDRIYIKYVEQIERQDKLLSTKSQGFNEILNSINSKSQVLASWNNCESIKYNFLDDLENEKEIEKSRQKIDPINEDNLKYYFFNDNVQKKSISNYNSLTQEYNDIINKSTDIFYINNVFHNLKQSYLNICQKQGQVNQNIEINEECSNIKKEINKLNQNFKSNFTDLVNKINLELNSASSLCNQNGQSQKLTELNLPLAQTEMNFVFNFKINLESTVNNFNRYKVDFDKNINSEKDAIKNYIDSKKQLNNQIYLLNVEL